MDPMFEDPFFRKFFGDRFRHPETPRERKSMNLGSGVIVSPDGYILTNTHVVKDADKIKVTLSDKREFNGKVIGNDPKTEISVIKIDGKDLPMIPVGDSDKLKVGEVVLAIGNPFGLNQTITMGIVSAVGRPTSALRNMKILFRQTPPLIPEIPAARWSMQKANLWE